MPKRAVACARVNSDDQVRDGYDLLAGCEIVQEFTEKGRKDSMIETTFRVSVQRCPAWNDQEVRQRVSAVYARILALEPVMRQEQGQDKERRSGDGLKL
jgi:hypothetical protein